MVLPCIKRQRFTRLATRLREAGMKVFGFGEKKTEAILSACDKFIYVEILSASAEQEEVEATVKPVSANVPKDTTTKQAKQAILKTDRRLINLIRASIDDIADEKRLGIPGRPRKYADKKQPNFDSRNYGFGKLVQLIKSISQFEIDERETGRGNIKHVYVKTK